jgi:oligopeptide/dipeptide ABC transporter ATP-binding protein
LELLADLQKRLGTTYLFITHDLSILQQISQKIVVLYLGLVMETGPTSAMLLNPLHPYTSALVASSYGRAGAQDRALVLDQGLGEVPSALNPPSGCPYRTRCPRAESICATEQPPLRAVRPSRAVACHFPLESV